jgi:hypothetical protein
MDRDTLPHSCHESEVTKQDQNFRDRNSSLHCSHISKRLKQIVIRDDGMHLLTLFLELKTNQDQNIKGRNASLHSFHGSNPNKDIRDRDGSLYSFLGIED